VRIRSTGVLLAVLLAGCSRAKDAPAREAADTVPPATLAAPAELSARQAQGGQEHSIPEPAAAAPGAPPPPPATGATRAYVPLKLIRTGQVSLEVKSTPAAVAAIQKLAAELGGYVAESRAARQSGDRQAGSLTVRVPAERFGEAVTAFKSLGKVVNESTSTQDVTKAYTDLETRLRVKREAAARVQEILKTRTARLSDVLEAERELARLTEEIEQMEGERRFYDQQIAMSTIAVEVHEPAPVLASSKLAPIGEALSASLEVLAGSVAALIFAVVALVPWLLVALVLRRVIRWARRRRKAAPPTAA
jgi:hypothetical protein